MGTLSIVAEGGERGPHTLPSVAKAHDVDKAIVARDSSWRHALRQFLSYSLVKPELQRGFVEHP